MKNALIKRRQRKKKNPFVGVANLGALLTLDTLPTRKPVSEKHYGSIIRKLSRHFNKSGGQNIMYEWIISATKFVYV